MKKLYISALLLMQLPVFGQNIIFQDPIFKQVLLSASPDNNIAKNSSNQNIKIDTNDDGEIQLSEALEVYSLYIYEKTITSIGGINQFQNLEKLELFSNRNLRAIHLNGLNNLTYFETYLDSLDELTINNCPSLHTIIHSAWLGTLNNFNGVIAPNLKKLNTNVTENFNHIDFTRYPLLEHLTISTGNVNPSVSMTSLDLSEQRQLEYLYLILPKLNHFTHNNLPKLDNVYIKRTKLDQINFSGSPLLRKVDIIDNTDLTEIITNGNPNIQNLIVTGNTQLTNLDITNKPLLTYAKIENSSLNELNFNGLSSLNNLILKNNNLNQVDFSPLLSLRNLELNEDHLTKIDVNSNNNLSSLEFRGQNLQNIYIKNGFSGINLTTYNSSFAPNLRYICSDSENFEYIHRRLNIFSFENVEVNDYCTFADGGSNYTILGKSYFDVNNNEYDAEDIHIPLQAFSVTINGSTHRYTTNLNGLHHIATVVGSTAITPFAEIPSYFNFTPSSASFTFPSTNNEVTQDFKVTANGIKNDLEVVLIPISQTRPGEVATYKLIYKNKGNTTQSGNLHFTYDQSVATLSTTSTPASSQGNGTLTWNFSNLKPFENREIRIGLLLNRPTDVPSLELGDFLNYTATVVAGTDETPTDNVFTLNEEIVNAFDPNDKTCLEGETISPEKVGEYVHYKIRFENLGSANAKNIVVRDEIDLDKFDISTLVPLDASHTFFTKVRDNNVAEFIFENIQLPFDDENNDGYVVFKIKTKPNLQLNDTFSNTAKIYFDYNHPIVTNTYTTAVRTLGTDELNSTNEAVSIYPNPVKDKVHFQSKEAILKADVYDANGRLIFVSPVQNNVLDVKDLLKGNYIIKTYSKKGFSTQKMIKN